MGSLGTRTKRTSMQVEIKLGKWVRKSKTGTKQKTRHSRTAWTRKKHRGRGGASELGGINRAVRSFEGTKTKR